MFNSVWYSNLIRPAFSPPNWIFAPVWVFLYISIFIYLALFTASKIEHKKSGFVFFSTQLLLNFIWSPVFFNFKSISGGLIIIILLDIFVILTIFEFFKASKIAGLILIPYLVWILFATYLNIGYLVLN